MEPVEIIGSKARLEILHHLTKKDRYVSELMDLVGMDGKTATHHLQTLEKEGIISSKKKGKRKYYSLERRVIVKISPSPNRRFQIQFPRIEEP
ncbi:MAG: winged helix-turn-helix transcriptional regulator [Candidatus Thermoplasmatota archaeon]|nr:winged helix-turn-helix transcriptional regulator [Candidatus Thermoplasmatota archaeon]